MDVLSNLPLAVAGAWGLTMMALTRRLESDGRRALAAVFFTGLLVTVVGSSIYHRQPDDWGLAWDRVGMVGAFAGLLGMAAADRISTRSGLWVAGLVLFASDGGDGRYSCAFRHAQCRSGQVASQCLDPGPVQKLVDNHRNLP